MAMKKLLRSMQVLFPWMLEFKFSLQMLYRRLVHVPFEPDFEVLKHISFAQDMCYIDVGCNRGQSIDAIRLYKKTANILAFEPNVDLYDKLVVHFKKSGNLQFYNFGLSETAGEFKLYLPVYKGWIFDGLASFSKKNAECWLDSKTMYFFKEEDLKIREIACNVRKLDEMDCKPCFIKIDVQGLEESVIKGSIKTIEKYLPVLLVETEDGQSNLINILPTGYLPCEYADGELRVGKYGMQNTIFMTNDHLARYDGKKVCET